MDRRAFCIRLFGIPATGFFTGARLWAVEPAASQPEWHTDFYKAHELSCEQNKPLLVVFGASWCGYCHKMQKTTYADPRIVERISGEFVPVLLDLDRNRPVA